MTLGSARPVSASHSTIGLAALVRRQAVEAAAVDQPLALRVGDVGGLDRRVGVHARGGHDAPDRQAELRSRTEVALVVGGHGHDRARAVAGQHVVGDEDRDPLAVDRVDRVGAERDAGLLAVGREALDLGPAARLVTYASTSARRSGWVSRSTSGMLRRQDHERRAEQRVRPRREDADLVAAGLVVVGRGLEVDLGALGPADPVRLLDPDRLRPVEAVEVEQLVGVLRRPQEPLLQVALLDERAAAPAAPVGALDLLARQGPVVGAPVDRRTSRGRPARPPGTAGTATGSTCSSWDRR